MEHHPARAWGAIALGAAVALAWNVTAEPARDPPRSGGRTTVTLAGQQTGSAASRPARPSPTPAAPADRRLQARAERLEQLIPDLLVDGLVPGLGIALVGDGRVAWARGFGVANAETKAPVTGDTVFEAASLSKPVFAYAVLKLVDAGKLDLDAPLTKYLPGSYDVVDDPRIELITARHVMSHRSGFPNWRQGPRDKPPLPIHFVPGERFSYSGEGFVYLSRAVETLTGQPLETLMRETVFGPLGMTSSSYVWRQDYETRKAYNHDALGQVAGRGKPSGANAAASLHTTATDFARFVAAILNGTGLKPATMDAMLSVQSQPLEGGPNSITRAPGRPIPELAWGLGWGLQRTSDGPSFWHWGDNGNNRSFVVAYPRRKTALVVHINGANGMLILPPLVVEAIGGPMPALAWLDYGTLASPAHAFVKAVATKGAAAAIADYRERRHSRPQSDLLPEDRVNAIGYVLLRSKRVPEAIEVFKLNVDDHPNSYNAHDSLGEAYAAGGERELAIRHYRRSLELNPESKSGIEALEKLGVK